MRLLTEFLDARPDGQILLGLDPGLMPVARELEAAGAAIGLSSLAILSLPAPARLAVVPPELTDPNLRGTVALLLTALTPGREHALLGVLSSRLRARTPGLRGGAGCFISTEWLMRAFSISRRQLKGRGQMLQLRLQTANHIRVRTPNGTDLTLELCGRRVYIDSGGLFAGKLGNLPGGEVFVAPLESSASGTLVVDVAAPGGVRLQNPVRLQLRHGRVVEADGTVEAQTLAALLGESRVGELGFGTHPALCRTGHPLCDEKVTGTGHVGFGHNLDWGGENREHPHLDCVFDRPSVWADEQLIVYEGVAL